MEDDEKIVVPAEELETTDNSAEAQGSVDEKETPKPENEDRITNLENNVQEINERFDQVITEQEKIVTVLDKISDKILSTDVKPIEEKVEEAEKAEKAEPKKANNAKEEPEETPQEDESEDDEVEDNACGSKKKKKLNSEEEATEDAENETEDEEEKCPECGKPLSKCTCESEEEVENSVKSKEDDEDDEESEEEEKVEPADEEEAPEEDPAEEEEDEKKKNNKETKMTKEELQEILNSFKADVVNEILDAKVEEPEVKESAAEETEETNPEIAQNWRQRYNDQVAAAWDFHRLNNIEAGRKLQAINQFNADLKVKNDAGTSPITITSLADFVLPPEMDKEIHGLRTNYTPFLNTLNYQQTNNLQFMYATRVGDINMQNVKFCDDGEDGNLKPVETYGLKRGIAQMEEMAAVTPICDNATKYMAVDILQDVAAGYRNDYDRKLAQLAIVRFQQALNETGNTIEYDPATAVDGLVDFVKATTLVSEGVVNGKFIFNARTKALLLENLLRSGNNDLGARAFTTGDTQTIWGYDYIVVPNDLLPTLGTDETRSFKAMNNQTGVVETVDITSPVFYGDFNEYRGKVNGGLNYTISTDASYEIDGTVYSAFQRDELVIRGYFYRGGYIADPTVIAGLVPASN